MFSSNSFVFVFFLLSELSVTILRKPDRNALELPLNHGRCSNPELIQKTVAVSSRSLTEVTMSLVQ